MKQIIVSGIQPTGQLHIGNYLGAVHNWLELQKNPEFECFFFIPDLHSITIEYDPTEKQRLTHQLVGDLLALGIDPDRVHMFVQSHIPEHTELAWIFNSITPMAELEKMTQYKDKAARNETNVNVGLFTYPILMAADILLYKATVIPVGEDQVQHVELARVIAKKFNKKFGETFPEPKSVLTKIPRVMSLAEPTKKMSKSHGEKSCIFIGDSPDVISLKLRKAVTDEHGVKNLLGLVELFDETGLTYKHLVKDAATGDLKNVELKDTLAELIAQAFAPFRTARTQISDAQIKTVLRAGHEAAARIAAHTMTDVRMKLGLR